MKPKSAQYSLPFLDTTSLHNGGFNPFSGFGKPAASDDNKSDLIQPTADDEPVEFPAHDFRLAGDRTLAHGWKARAADNLAAVRL